MTEPPLLVGRGLTYAARGRRLVEAADVQVDPGTLQVIVGPNGAGKSTLLRLLSGELPPLAGTLAYAGEPAAAIPPWRLATLRAVMPQAARLTFPFAAAEVARIGLDGIGRRLDRRAREAILDEALSQADVLHLADRIYATLSGGEQARVQFARALCQLAAGRTVAPRQVLFLDEPTASLDLRHQSGVLDAAVRIAAKGNAVVAILHDLNLAAAYADTLLVMEAGRIVASGTPADIIRDDLLVQVFGVPWRVGQVPSADQPFVLPQRRMALMPQS